MAVTRNQQYQKAPSDLFFNQTALSFGIKTDKNNFWENGRYLNTGRRLPSPWSETARGRNIGVWGQRHKRYLKQNHKVRYYNLLTSDKLDSYLSDIEKQAQNLFLRLVKDLTEKENVTEELKSTDMMIWVWKMNNVRNRATEIVNVELIYTV